MLLRVYIWSTHKKYRIKYMANERTVSGVAVDNDSIMCVEVHVFFFVFCDSVFFFFYGLGGCQDAMSEKRRFIASLYHF